VADLTRDALKGQPIHVDLHKINLEEKVRVKVPVSLKGSPIGVQEGGLLDFHMHVLEIECLPAQIPEHIDVDITNLKIGGSLHVSDVQIPAGFKVIDEQTATIVNILGKAVEAEAAAQEAE
jgi:large subunit ribosomal protein L25